MKLPALPTIKAFAKPPAPPPRKAAKPTSYTATGIAPPPQLDSELGSSYLAPVRELVPELTSPFSRTQVYAKMMNDAGVDVSMRVAKTPVLSAEYFMEPFSDNPQDQLISEFVWANLFEGMSAPFLNSIEDILHMYEDGYSILEQVFEERVWSQKATGANSRKYTMLKKLAFRPATTVKEIVYDNNGGPTKVVQNAVQSDGSVTEKTLPIEKIVIFSMNKKGGDLTGKSLLRTAYPHWYYKTHFYKIDAIQKERHSLGVPKGKLLPGYNQNDPKILRQLLRNLRTNEESFMVLTPNVDVEFAEIHGNLVNVLESAMHHNMMIMLNVMAQFLVLGTEGTGGGRATAGAQSDIFMKSLRHIANYIADSLNMYLIPQLVVWNFPTNNFPKLKVRNIGETRDLQMLGSALANLFAQQAITHDDPTENWIRRVFDMPSKTATPDAGAASTNGNAPPSQTNGNAPQAPQAQPNPQKGNVAQPRDKVGSNVGVPQNAPQ
jgi:Protein of unknown function (DUF935)